MVLTNNNTALHVKYFKVVKEFDGRSSSVAFHLTRPEAEQFIKTAQRRLRRTRTPDFVGESYFEVTAYRLEEDTYHG